MLISRALTPLLFTAVKNKQATFELLFKTRPLFRINGNYI